MDGYESNKRKKGEWFLRAGDSHGLEMMSDMLQYFSLGWDAKFERICSVFIVVAIGTSNLAHEKLI